MTALVTVVRRCAHVTAPADYIDNGVDQAADAEKTTTTPPPIVATRNKCESATYEGSQASA